MSLESVRAFFAEKAPDITVIESPISSATVPLAAEAYGVEPGMIAKTLSLRVGERVILIVAAGTSRMDNKKVKAQFGGKPKMLGLEEVADITVIESPISSATVPLAAEAYGVEPGMIAKTLSLRVGERVILIVAAGTSRMDNKKVKAQFGGKPKMLGLEEVAEITGHEVGGVCPFGLKSPLPVYCDVSLKAFDVVVPAAGSTHSAVRITPERMAELTAAAWVDVCEVRP